MEAKFEIGDDTTVYVYPSQHSVEDILRSKVDATDRNEQEDPFFVVNLGRLAALYKQVCRSVKILYPTYVHVACMLY